MRKITIKHADGDEIYVPYVDYQKIENDRHDLKNLVIPALRAEITMLKEVCKLLEIKEIS